MTQSVAIPTPLTGKVVRVSDDFLKANQHYKLVITVIKLVLENAHFDMQFAYTVIALSTFERYTYVQSKKNFTTTRAMRPLMEALEKVGIKADMPDPDPSKKWFRVCLNIPLVLAEKHLDLAVYQIAVKMSPVYDNPVPTVRLDASGNSHADLGEETAVDARQKEEPQKVPLASTNGVTVRRTDQEVVQIVKKLSVHNGLAVPGKSPGRVPFEDQGSTLFSLMVLENKTVLARKLFSEAHLQWKEGQVRNAEQGDVIFRFFNGSWNSSALHVQDLQPEESTSDQVVLIHQERSEPASERSVDVELDQEISNTLTVEHPRSILTATDRKKKLYLSQLVAKHGNGLKLLWVAMPDGADDDGWRVREISKPNRSLELRDLLALWGYDVAPELAKRTNMRGLAPTYFLLHRLEPLETAQFFDDSKQKRAGNMQALMKELAPQIDRVKTDLLENILPEDWSPEMKAEDLLKLLRRDIRTLSQITNLANFQVLAAESLADQVLEVMNMLGATPIVESSPLEVSVGSGFRVGLAVRPDTFKNMLKERILYLSLRNNVFKFRDGS